MKAWLGLVRFEVERSWLVLVAGVLAGLAALAAPSVWTAGTGAPAEIRGAAAVTFGALLLLLSGVLVGSRTLVGGVTARTDELLLAYPVGVASLWSARVVATLLLAFSAAMAALVPVAVVEPGVRGEWLAGAPVWGAVAIAAGLLAIAAGAVVRALATARSLWLAALGLAVWIYARMCGGPSLDPLRWAAGDPHFAFLLLVAVWAGLAAPLLAATLTGAALGRADLARWARWAGAVAVAGLLGATGAIRAWTAVATAPTAAHLTRIVVARSLPAEGWALVGGVARRAGLETFPWFALHVETGHWYRLGLVQGPGSWLPRAAAGRFLALTLPVPRTAAGTVHVFELLPEGPHRIASVPTLGRPLAISHDGRLIAVEIDVAGGRSTKVQVLEVPSGRFLRELRLPQDPTGMFWLEEDGTLRALTRAGEESEGTRLLVSPAGTQAWREAWHAPGRLAGLAGGDTVLALHERRTDGHREVSVRRLADGAELWRCPLAFEVAGEAWPSGRLAFSLVRPDGLLEALLDPPGPRELVLHTPAGMAWRTRLPAGTTWLAWGGSPSPGTYLLGLSTQGNQKRVLAVDLRDGSMRRLPAGTYVASWWPYGPAERPPLVIRGGRLYRVTPALELEPVPVR